MAQITFYMNYTIFFNDTGLYQLAVAAANGNWIQLSPRDAAVMFGIPHPYPSGPIKDIPAGIYFDAYPFFPGAEFRFPNPTGIFVDDNISSFLVPGQTPFPSGPNGPDGLFIWAGVIILMQGAGTSSDPPVPTIAQRRWSVGFESADELEGPTMPQTALSRDASRVNDGLGLVIRGQQIGPATIALNKFRTGLVTPTSWERFYVRFRRIGSDFQGFWRARGTGDFAGFALLWVSTGEVKGFNINTTDTTFDAGTVFTPVINTWYRVDVFIKFATGVGTTARIRIYINGVFTYSFDDSIGQGMNQVANHTSSRMGRMFSFTSHDFEIDMDDWINSDLPSNVSADTLAFTDVERGIDWLLGSHLRRPYSVTGSFTNWGGGTTDEFANLNQGINPIQGVGGEIVSTTSGANMRGDTDAASQDDQFAVAELVLGAASAVVGLNSRNSGGTDGQLGYKIAGGADVLTTIDQTNFFESEAVAYQPSGMVLPDEINTPGPGGAFSVVHTKSADGNTDTVRAMVASVEWLGVWGPEDDPLFAFPINRLTNLHNCPYLNTQWGYGMAPPTAFVMAVSGTNIGNDKENQYAVDAAPVHFFMARRVGVSNAGLFWCSTSLGGARTFSRLVSPDIRARFDIPSLQFLLEVNGTDTNINASGATYHFNTFGDPENRFMLNGVYSHATSSTSPYVNPLINTEFLAEAGFVHRNELDTLFGGDGVWYKGPGIPGNSFVSLSSGAVISDAGSFELGTFTTRADLHQPVANMAYSLWRTSDGSDCSDVMVQLLSYTGDGVSPRNITLTPTSGRFPCFAMVVPTNGSVGRFRDPSHVGTNSAFLSSWGDDGSGGIEGVAIDQITVGASLNANGVVYSVFAICGGLTNSDGVFFPAPCSTPPGGPRRPPNPPTGINVLGNGGLIFNGAPSLLLLKDVTGIYTLVPGKLNDTLYDRQTGITSVERPIVTDAKTGYIGG